MYKTKRILSVRLIREVDTDADTSYLGEYSNLADSEYAIDRRHALDCQSVSLDAKQAIDKLERIISFLNIERTAEGNKPESTEWEPLDEAIDTLIALQDDLLQCDCGGHNISSREYRYFNPPVENYKGESPEHIRNYSLEDYERMESLNAGDWCYIGIRAQARVQLTSDLVQTITSGGLWGIESDSDESYLKEVESEQLAELKSQLRAIGFSTRAISKAFKSITEERP